MTAPRFYAESDGDPWNKRYYVVDRYGDPTDGTYDCPNMRAARKLAREYNTNPPCPPWDTMQAERDGYGHEEAAG